MLFSQIIGQEDVKKKLIQSVRDNRVAHAQLFLGPEGSGSLALAIAYAQYINCTNRSENDSCGVCPSCKKINNLVHPDLHFVFPNAATKTIKSNTESDMLLSEWRDFVASTEAYGSLQDWYKSLEIENKQGMINVRDAATIMHKLNLKTYEAEYKIAIIWMADKFNITAANRLLKMLEEPPEKTVFLLVAENQEDLLSTIRSRTLLMKVPKLSVEEIQSALIHKFGCDFNTAHNAALISNGDWNAASHYIDDSEDEKLFFNCFQRWMRYCFRFSASELIDFIANDIKPLGREKQKNFLAYGLKVFHNAILHNNGLRNNVLLPDNELAFLNNFAPFVSNNNIGLITELFEESIRQIERNGNASLIFMDDSYKIFNYFKIR